MNLGTHNPYFSLTSLCVKVDRLCLSPYSSFLCYHTENGKRTSGDFSDQRSGKGEFLL